MAIGRVFFSAALTAQNSPELHFHFINSFIQSSLLRSLVQHLKIKENENFIATNVAEYKTIDVGRGIKFSDKEYITNFSNFLFYSKQSISLSYLVKWMWMAVTTTTRDIHIECSKQFK